MAAVVGGRGGDMIASRNDDESTPGLLPTTRGAFPAPWADDLLGAQRGSLGEI